MFVLVCSFRAGVDVRYYYYILYIIILSYSYYYYILYIIHILLYIIISYTILFLLPIPSIFLSIPSLFSSLLLFSSSLLPSFFPSPIPILSSLLSSLPSQSISSSSLPSQSSSIYLLLFFSPLPSFPFRSFTSPSSSIPIPSSHSSSHHSKYTCRHLHTLIYIQSSSTILTPHVLSEWMVEVCRFEVCGVRFMFRAGVMCSGLT